MQGSFETPPIVIRSSRFFYSVTLLISAGLFAMWAVRFSYTNLPMGWNDGFWAGGSGVWILASACMLVSPSYLKLGPDGLTWSSILGSRDWAWNDIRNFRVGPLGTVGCDLANRDSAFKWLRPANKTMTGSHGALGFGWEDGSAAVVSTLIAARAHWLRE